MHIKIGAADFWTCSKWIHQTVFLIYRELSAVQGPFLKCGALMERCQETTSFHQQQQRKTELSAPTV